MPPPAWNAAIAEELAIDFNGEPLHLLADRAVYWPRRNSLLLADLHLGKGDRFREVGLALPSGGSRLDLERLQRLLLQTGADSVYLLGDVLHGREHGTAWRQAWLDWRARHATLRIVALTGNHDRWLARADLAIELAGAQLVQPPLLLSHTPLPERTGVVCGHLHPVVKLPGLPRRWPAFVIGARQLLLPAFSQFTGGLEWAVDGAEQLIVCNGEQLIALPPGNSAGRQG